MSCRGMPPKRAKRSLQCRVTARSAGLDQEVEGLRETVCARLWPTPIPRDSLIRSCQTRAQAVHAAPVELSLASRAHFLPEGPVMSGTGDLSVAEAGESSIAACKATT